MNRKQEAMERGTLIGAAFADLDEAVSEMIVDPREIVRIEAQRLTQLRYPTPDKERQAAATVRSFQPRIEELVANGDIPGLRRLLGDIAERCRRLAIPDRMPSLQDDLRDGGMQTCRNASWSTEEVEATKYFARAGDRLGKVTPSTVQLGNREITRAEVREAMAARGWDRNRLARLAEQEKQRNQVDAGNLERTERGLAPIIYTGNVERA